MRLLGEEEMNEMNEREEKIEGEIRRIWMIDHIHCQDLKRITLLVSFSPRAFIFSADVGASSIRQIRSTLESTYFHVIQTD